MTPKNSRFARSQKRAPLTYKNQSGVVEIAGEDPLKTKPKARNSENLPPRIQLVLITTMN